jgi:hypothetical protein
MYTNDIKLTDYKPKSVKSYTVQINSSWIEILDGDVTVYRRQPQNDDWYDTGHQRIVNAIQELESALLAVITR